MSQRTCSVTGCSNPLVARELCVKHYARFKTNGTTELLVRPAVPTETRFFAKVTQGQGDCWLWTASVSHGGYGIFRAEGRTRVAHRWAYEFMVGPIPDGLHLDHLCSIRACVNPWHLDPVPQAVNNTRSRAGEVNKARLSGATHCQRGHEFSMENTGWSTNGKWRRCKICHRAAVDARRHRLREAADLAS